MEEHIAETLDKESLIDGIETAEEEIFYEHNEANAAWEEDVGNDSLQERVESLEESLVSLRVVRQIIENADLDPEELQDIATSVPMEDATTEEILDSADAFENAM